MKQREILSEVPGEEKMFPYKLPRPAPHLGPQGFVVEQKADTVRRPFGRVDEKAGMIIDHLKPNTAGVAADNRLPLPKTFGNGETEPFPGGFLNNDVGKPLQRIDRPVGIRRQQQDVNIGISRSRL